MGGPPKYDWYEVIQQCAELVRGGTTTFKEMAEALDMPRISLSQGLKRELGIDASTIERIPDLAKDIEPDDPTITRPEKPEPVEQVKYRFAEDGSKTVEKVIGLSESEMTDPVVIMRKMGLDPVRWEMISCELERKAFQVTMKLSQGSDEHGNKAPEAPYTETNYAFNCKIRVRPLQDRLSQANIRAVFDELEPPRLSRRKYKPSSLMLEAGIYDPHFGKQAWADETGEVNYDLDIAERDYRAVIDGLIGRVDAYGLAFERVLFPVGQDYFHIDTTHNTTTSGTQVDTDDRWQKIYKIGVESLIYAVEALRELAPVEVIYVPGNHDEMMSFFATLHLDAFFKGIEDVTVDTSPGRRKYRRYGSNLIGFSHGRDDRKRIEKLMQVEAAADWGETTHREFHLGDLHHEQAKEDGGIIFRRISAITATDAWHAERGWVGVRRKAQAFVWSRDAGLETILNVGVGA